MSGIYISNNEMPKTCYDNCPCQGVHWCNVLKEITEPMTGKRLNNCPLVTVLPHGRLIDEEQLIKNIDDAIENIVSDFPLLDFNSRYCMERGLRMAKIFVKAATTIIPADKEDGE